ncbi:hypothetical protein AX14_010373 [Amanita brunnescens Koide BX004]|nr:hypothetical protein AX14_010373 [Amanita brunnescens Koide BX004]
MVLSTKLTFAAALSALVGTVAGQNLQIIQPNANWWWVAKSQNTMSWDCTNPPAQQYTVLITNSNPAVLSGPLAFIAELSNSDCSELLTQDQINQAPATGYQLLFADILNSSHVYGTSEPFEIKALGSAYPTSSAPAAGSATATGTGSSSSATSTSKSHSGASNVKASMGLGLAAVGAVLGFMTA